MQWIKKGLMPIPELDPAWATTHVIAPTPVLVNDSVLRIYASFCDANMVGRVGYIDYDANDLTRILAYSSTPVLSNGPRGTFDQDGVLVCSVLKMTEKVYYMYYVGFELGTKIRYRLLTGLAISEDAGKSFMRRSDVPILERSHQELYFRGGPFALQERGLIKLWYVAGSDWLLEDGKEAPVYTINYLESQDGIRWDTSGKVVIDIDYPELEHGFGRPYVIKHEGIYKMFYSIRKRNLGYRLGYAESHDGVNWTRKDDQVGLDVSTSGFDSEVICYMAVINIKDKFYAFYNGNGLGKEGFGYAELSAWH